MGFNPINDDHAIELVSFSIALDTAVGDRLGQGSLSLINRLKEDMPAIGLPRSFNPELQAPNITPPLTGIEFSRFRPDGTYVWLAKIVGAELTVECTRYTRWRRVWPQVKNYLSDLAAIVAASSEGHPPVGVRAIVTSVRDAFVTTDGGRANALLKNEHYLAMPAPAAGNLWHLNQGWFVPCDNGQILHRLDIQGRKDHDIYGMDKPGGDRVSITHLQSVQYEKNVPLADLVTDLEDRFTPLHVENKAVLRSVLVDELAERIGLNKGDSDVGD